MSATQDAKRADVDARLWRALKAASLVYLAFEVSQVWLGRERRLWTPALPAGIAAALWLPMPEGWWFLLAALPLCACRHLTSHGWPLAALLAAAAGASFRLKKIFFPPGRLFHWAFGALAVWFSIILFGLPRAERSFSLVRLEPSMLADLQPHALDVPAPRRAQPDPAPSAPEVKPVIPEPPPPPKPWNPSPELARKLALIHERAPQKILEGDPDGTVMRLTVELDDQLKSPEKDEARIEETADKVLAVLGPEPGPKR